VLRGLGVDYGQGWHFGRPGPPEALTSITPPAAVPAPRRELLESAAHR
jgi:sensor c-di-GMP phosphodiesterase-like protein